MKNSQETRQLSEREQQKFQDLYQKFHHRVYSTCIRMTQNVSESEDLTQDVFLRLFRTIGSFRGESSFTTWLHRLTVNLVLMHFRKHKRRTLLTEAEALSADIIEDAQDPVQMRIVDRILLSEVMARLPHGYREAIILHDVEGFEHSEIAESKGRSIGTSKSQLHKGRVRLRQLITGRSQRATGPSVVSTA